MIFQHIDFSQTLTKKYQLTELFTDTLRSLQSILPEVEAIEFHTHTDDSFDHSSVEFLISTKTKSLNAQETHNLLSSTPAAASAALQAVSITPFCASRLGVILKNSDDQMFDGVAIIKNDIFYVIHDSAFLVHKKLIQQELEEGREAPLVSLLSDTPLSEAEKVLQLNRFSKAEPDLFKWISQYQTEKAS